MAVVWERQVGDVLYQVQQRGDCMRLFANGVQHSEYHPRRLVTGSVWDLLWLPALLSEPERFRRVLILGLGGGTLLPPIRRLLAPDTLVAVEMDPNHLAVAREVFSVVGDNEQTILADAVSWLRDYDGEPFDLIIEDLFSPTSEVVTRAVPAKPKWLRTLARNVSSRGTLVMNFGDLTEYRYSHAADQQTMAGWSSRFRLACGDSYNAVVALTREPTRSVDLRRRLQRHPQLSPLLRQRQLDYHIRQLD